MNDVIGARAPGWFRIVAVLGLALEPVRRLHLSARRSACSAIRSPDATGADRELAATRPGLGDRRLRDRGLRRPARLRSAAGHAEAPGHGRC